jgi:UDP-N-acetylmuramoyl-tripeptide--D-alanyl-D-alanine ligase
MKQATLLQIRKIIAYCMPMSVQHFLNNGFQVVNRRKSITQVEKVFPQENTKIDFPTLLSVVNGQLVHGEAFAIFHITDKTKFLTKPNTVIFIRDSLSDAEWKHIQGIAPCAVVLTKEQVPLRFLPNISYITVDDMDTSYWNFVRYYRSMFNIPVFAITGTCGKTTTKEMITHILQHKHNVESTRKSNNSFYRNLTYLCGITKETDAAVFETPVGRPGLLVYHCQYFQPTIGMITNIGIDHLKQCGTLENYIQAKGEILQGLNYKGTLLLNSDDERTKAISLKPYKGKVIYFGVHAPADYRATQIQYGVNGMNFMLHYDNMEYPIFVPGYGEHQVYNALSAIAAVHQMGIKINEAADQLKTFKNVTAHVEILQGPNESMIINDTWSSNPTSIEAALKVLQEIAHNREKVVILGSVSWLGENEAEIHRQIGMMLANYPIDLLFAFGEFSNEIVLGAKSQNMAGKMIICKSVEDIEKQLFPLLNKETAVLIKTSMHDKSKVSLVNKLNKGIFLS